MGIGEDGEQVGINRTKISDPNAKYFNDQTWIGHVWTEEEMWEQWNAQIEAASAMQRSNAPTGTLGLALRCRTGTENKLHGSTDSCFLRLGLYYLRTPHIIKM